MTEAPWIEWKGGECPVPLETKVDVRFRGGAEASCDAAYEWTWEWEANDAPGDIIAYRVVTPLAKEKPMETVQGSPVGKYLSFQTDAPQRPEPNFTTRITEAEEMAKDAFATLKDACTTFSASSWDEGDGLLSSAFDEIGVRLNRAVEAFIIAAALARDYARREV